MTKQFWSRFSQKQWEKSATVFKDIARDTPLDAQAIFDILVRYCDSCRERDITDGLKFYVGGIRLESFEMLEHLPVAGDLSLEGYNRRVSREFSDYGLVCDELLQIDDPRWKYLQDFTKGLFKQVGLPNRFAEVGLYLGNYRKTPFGVHVDRCGVFSFPVVGKKCFRLWPAKFVELHPELQEAFSYDEFKTKSQVLNCGVGDVAYWPSSDWHIAESDGKFSATWSIGVWVDETVTDVVVRAIEPALRAEISASIKKSALRTSLAAPRLSHTSSGQIVTLPPSVADAIDAIAAMTKTEMRDIARVWWVEHASKQGLRWERKTKRNSLTQAPRKLREGDLVQGSPSQPIYWSKLSKGRMVWSAAGMSNQMKYDQSLTKLIDDLNAGQIITFSKSQKPSIRQLLSAVSILS